MNSLPRKVSYAPTREQSGHPLSLAAGKDGNLCRGPTRPWSRIIAGVAAERESYVEVGLPAAKEKFNTPHPQKSEGGASTPAKRYLDDEILEARGGIEPPIMVLQTIALPLGDRAAGRKSFQFSVISGQLKKKQLKAH